MEEKKEFEVGGEARVYFKNGRNKVGKIIKVNAKTIVVHLDEFPPCNLVLKKYKCKPI